MIDYLPLHGSGYPITEMRNRPGWILWFVTMTNGQPSVYMRRLTAARKAPLYSPPDVVRFYDLAERHKEGREPAPLDADDAEFLRSVTKSGVRELRGQQNSRLR